MAERAFLVLAGAAGSSAVNTLDEALRQAGVAVDKDRTSRLVVQIIGEVRPRSAPNVDVVLFEQDQGNG